MKKRIALYHFLLVIAACNGNRGAANHPNLPLGNDSNQKTSSPVSDSGWVTLFDGKTLSGWHEYGKKSAGSAWIAENETIHLHAGIKNGYQTAGGGDLVSDEEFGPFDLKLEWKIGKKANSGIMIFVKEDTLLYKETWYTGPEIQVCDKDSNEDAHSLKHEAGDLYDLISSSIMSARPAMEWNQVEIINRQDSLEIFLNGIPVISTRIWDEDWKKLIAGSKFRTMPGFGSFHSGHIALQDHGEEVWYRQIRIRKL